MKPNEMIEAVKASVSKIIGASYDERLIESVCNAGYNAIPDGTIVGNAGDQSLVKFGMEILCVKDGAETKRTPVAGREDHVVMMYAAIKCRKAVLVG